MRLTQVKKLTTPQALQAHLDELCVDLKVDTELDPRGPLASPFQFTDGSAGTFEVPNRFAMLPMEGWDASPEGRPTDLVRRRWGRFADSGAGLMWGEATAIRRDGRANPNQLYIDESTIDAIAELRAMLPKGQIAGLQLTHSGRWSRPDGSPRPRTAYQHPILDAKVGADAISVLSDDELDELIELYISAAALAAEAGFDFVDIKHCHGYLLHELLSARDRPGRYGGDLEGRTRFVRGVIAGIRERVPQVAVAVRLSIFDTVPFEAGEDGTGVPVADASRHRGFGGDQTPHGVDLTETHAMLDLLGELGVGLVCTTAGSPYYNAHIQRPAYFPPADGYLPPEDPLVGVARQIAATAELTRRHPDIAFIGSGYSYLQDWLAHVGQAVIANGQAAMIGLGRMALSYPHLPADVLAGRSIERPLICRTFSDCTTGPRNGTVSGCFPIDPFYKSHPQRVEVAAAKKRAQVRAR